MSEGTPMFDPLEKFEKNFMSLRNININLYDKNQALILSSLMFMSLENFVNLILSRRESSLKM